MKHFICLFVVLFIGLFTTTVYGQRPDTICLMTPETVIKGNNSDYNNIMLTTNVYGWSKKVAALDHIKSMWASGNYAEAIASSANLSILTTYGGTNAARVIPVSNYLNFRMLYEGTDEVTIGQVLFRYTWSNNSQVKFDMSQIIKLAVYSDVNRSCN